LGLLQRDGEIGFAGGADQVAKGVGVRHCFAP
jgi:hypothetical protein